MSRNTTTTNQNVRFRILSTTAGIAIATSLGSGAYAQCAPGTDPNEFVCSGPSTPADINPLTNEPDLVVLIDDTGEVDTSLGAFSISDGATAGAMSFTNNGTVGGGFTAISYFGGDVEATGNSFSLINAGEWDGRVDLNGVLGGNASFTNSGTMDAGFLRAQAVGARTFDNSGDFTGDVIFDLDFDSDFDFGTPVDNGDGTSTTTNTSSFSRVGGAIDFSNSGTFNGSVDLSTMEDTAFANSGELNGDVFLSGGFASETSEDIFTTDDFSDPNVSLFEQSSTFETTPVDISITAENSGTLAGNVFINGTAESTLDNLEGGTIEGFVSVEAGGSARNSTSNSVSRFNRTTPDADTTVDVSENSFTRSETSTSLLGTAGLTNAGTIGAEDAPTSVDVIGVGGASVANTGEIYGSTFVYARVTDSTSTDSNQSTTTTTSNSATGTSTSVTVSSNARSDSTTWVGGEGSLTNAEGATIDGDVDVYGLTSAKVDNAGTINGDIDAWSEQTDSQSSSGDTRNDTFTFASSSDSDTADGVTTTTSSSSSDRLDERTSTSSFSQETVGGDARVTNTGTAGDPDEFAFNDFDVQGFNSATAEFGGTVLANDIDIDSVGFASSSESQSSNTFESSNTNSFVGVSDGTTVTNTFTSSGTSTSQSESTRTDTNATTGGTASLVASGTVGGESNRTFVEGFTAASADVSGTLEGTSLEVRSTGFESTTTSDQTGQSTTTNDSETVTTSTSDADSSTETRSDTVSSASSGENALTRSETSGTTGGTASLDISGTAGGEFGQTSVSGFTSASVDVSGTLDGTRADIRSSGSSFTRDTTEADSFSSSFDRQTDTSTVIVSTADDDTTTETFSETFSRADSSEDAQTVTETSSTTGGTADLTVSGTMGGEFNETYVSGFTSASVDVSGTLDGTYADIRSSGSSRTTDTSDANTVSSTFDRQTDTSTVTVSTADADTTTETRAETVSGADSSEGSQTFSETFSTTGGTADLTVSGTMGDEENGASTFVSGFTSASATVAESGTLDSDLYVSSFGSSRTTDTSNANTGSSTFDRQTDSTTVTTADGTTETRTETLADTNASSETSSLTEAREATGGTASADISGTVGSEDLERFVSVSGDAGASLDVSGELVGSASVSSSATDTTREEQSATSRSDTYDETSSFESDGTTTTETIVSAYAETTESSSSDSSSSTASGGIGSLDVSGTLGNGDDSASVRGDAGATADISGEVAGGMSVRSDRSDTTSTSMSDETTGFENEWDRTTVRTIVDDGTNITETGDYTEATSREFTSSRTGTSTSSGGMASLEVSGVVGDGNDFVSVSGNAGATANLTGKVDGSLSLSSFGRTSESGFSETLTESSSRDYQYEWVDGDFSTFNDVRSSTRDRSTEETSSFTETGGDVSLSTSGGGTVTGSVSMSSGGDANLNNSGTLEGGVFLSAEQRSGDFSQTTVETETTDSTAVRELVEDGPEYTETRQSVTVTSSTTEVTDNSTDGTASASLVNSGTIGTRPEAPVSATVRGQGSATATNSGTIYGDLNVSTDADASTFASSEQVDSSTTVDYVAEGELGESEPETYQRDTVIETGRTYSQQFTRTDTGGAASATNLSSLTVTGNVNVDGQESGQITNTGAIWGNASAGSEATAEESTYDVTTSETRTTNDVDGDVTETVVSETVIATTSSDTNIGGAATVDNTGTIGLRRINEDGGITITGGDVEADGLAGGTVTNTATGVIRGDVTARSEETNFASTFDQSETLDEVTSPDGDVERTTVTETASTSTETAVGGEATVVNDGEIGRRFASSDRSGGTFVTPAGDVRADGLAGATVTNRGSIGGGAEAISSGFNETSTSESSQTVVENIDASDSSNTTYQRSATSSSTSTSTQVGGEAVIENAAGAEIGSDVLNGNGVEEGAGAFIQADGIAGARVTNDGSMTGSVFARSYADSATVTDSTTTEEMLEGGFIESRTTATANATDETIGGGTATIVNNGQIDGSGSDFALVSASGFAGASVTNAADAEIEGNVSASSQTVENDTSRTQTTELGENGVLASQVTEVSDSSTWVGNDALVDNQGLIAGSANASAVNLARVVNAEDAEVGGSLSASSAFVNRNFDSRVQIGGAGLSETFTEVETIVGGTAEVVNDGDVGGSATASAVTLASVTNSETGSIQGSLNAYSFYTNTVNEDGIVTETETGGSALIENRGRVGGGFSVTAFESGTLTNTATGTIGANGGFSGSMFAAEGGMNTFENAGVIGLPPSDLLLSVVLGDVTAPSGSISFTGNTMATNSGVISADLFFTEGDSSFTFQRGSLLNGSIENEDGTLGLVFQDQGLFAGEVIGVTSTEKTGSGRWVLTGQNLELGETVVSEGTVQLGLPGFDVLVLDLIDVVGLVDPLDGLNPFDGNTAIDPRFSGLGLDDETLLAIAGLTALTGNLQVADGATFMGDSVIIGNVSNDGTFLPGYMLTQDGQPALENLNDNTSLILPGTVLITGDYEQGETGAFRTNFAPTVNRAELEAFGVQDEFIGSPNFQLAVSPFEEDLTPSALLKVTGDATVNGEIDLYVQRGGLYLNGDSTDIMEVDGTLTANATVNPNADSMFVDFALTSRSEDGKTIASVAAQRTSYGAFAETRSQQEMGQAFDVALVDVVTAIRNDDFDTVAEFEAAQDMAGLLSAIDWTVSDAGEVNGILSDTGGGFIALLPLVDTGAGFVSATQSRIGGRTGLAEGADRSRDTSFWVDGNYATTDVGENEGNEGLEADTYTLAIGGDQRITENALVGLAAGYSYSEVAGSKGSDAEISALSVGVYTNINPTERFYIDAMAWAQIGDVDATREMAMLDRTASSESDFQELRFDGEIGYRFQLSDNVKLTPFGGVRAHSFDFDTIEEEGAGGMGLLIDGFDDTTFQGFIGAQIEGQYEPSYDLVVRPIAALQVMSGPDYDGPEARFQGSNTAFQMAKGSTDDAVFAPSIGLDVDLGKNLSVFTGYRGEFSDAYDRQAFTVTVRARW